MKQIIITTIAILCLSSFATASERTITQQDPEWLFVQGFIAGVYSTDEVQKDYEIRCNKDDESEKCLESVLTGEALYQFKLYERRQKEKE